MSEATNTQVLYFYNGKYYTLRREIKDRRQYYITLIEVEIEDGSTDSGAI